MELGRESNPPFKVDGVGVHDSFEYCYCSRLEKRQGGNPESAYTSS